MFDDEKYKFLDMEECKKGWIQEEFENLFDMISDNSELEFLADPRIIFQFGINEAKELIKRLEKKIQFIQDNN